MSKEINRASRVKIKLVHEIVFIFMLNKRFRVSLPCFDIVSNWKVILKNQFKNLSCSILAIAIPRFFRSWIRFLKNELILTPCFLYLRLKVFEFAW